MKKSLKMYDIWYDYVKPKYSEKSKLYYIDTCRFVVYIKTNVIYQNITKKFEIRFDTSNYELDRPLPKGEKRNWINKRWIRWKNYDKISWVKSKNL